MLKSGSVSMNSERYLAVYCLSKKASLFSVTNSNHVLYKPLIAWRGCQPDEIIFNHDCLCHRYDVYIVSIFVSVTHIVHDACTKFLGNVEEFIR